MTADVSTCCRAFGAAECFVRHHTFKELKVMAKIESVQELFEHGLRYVYDCEQKLVKKGLPGMIEAAFDTELRRALERHLQETRMQVGRLERVFTACGLKADAEDNDVLDEMTKAAEKMIKAIEAPEVRDAAVIVSGNQVEHYEMATYGSLIAFAEQLGFSEAVTLLRETLQEEKAADAKLTQIAETSVNARANQRRAA
jgi:ferritin-like metal-binding protein YciE